MTQNTSSAVMQQRIEAHDSLDDFPTPPWATRALLHELQAWGFPLGRTCREPCANRGHMVKPLREFYGDHVDAADVHDYGAGFPVRDYLFGPDPEGVDWTFANPPFRLALEFIHRMRRTSGGCAVLVRTSFIEGCDRHRELFAKTPPSLMLQYAERVVMHKGRLSPDGSTATSYCWLIWLAWENGLRHTPRLGWIPPCRKKFERVSDYEVPA